MITEDHEIKQKVNQQSNFSKRDTAPAQDFNDWILGGAKDQGYYGDEGELAKNLLLLQKHSLIDVKLCKMNISGVKDPDNINRLTIAM